MPLENLRQADLLQGAHVIGNAVGTAPGQWLRQKDKFVVLLPGPASEMHPMMERTVIPLLRGQLKPIPYDSFTLHTFGRPESSIDEKIRPIIQRRRSLNNHEWVNFCILAYSHRVDLKVEARSPSRRRLDGFLRQIRKELEAVIGSYIYGENDESLESVVGEFLLKRHQCLSVAESCTGGLLGEMITRVPGSSRYFVGGVLAYSNSVKNTVLGIPLQELKKWGAVSSQVAQHMAQAVRRRFNTDYGLAVSGIAGPGGGTPEKPVGLVYIGLAGSTVSAYKYSFRGSREEVRERSAMTALDLLRRELQGDMADGDFEIPSPHRGRGRG